MTLSIGLLLFQFPYLPHAINSSFLRGQKGPDIFDLQISPFKKIDPIQKTMVPYYPVQVHKDQIDGFQKYVDETKTIAFLVAVNDSILFEEYFRGYSSKQISNSFSMAKTVISLLIGIAIEEKRIHSLDDPIQDYLSHWNTNGKYKPSIREVLQMASGLNWTESGGNPFSNNAAAYYGNSINQLMEKVVVVEKPGVYYNYQSGNTQILAMLLKYVYKKGLSDLVNEKIWTPMEMSGTAFWSTDESDFEEKAYCCLYATPKDFLKLGILLANSGVYKGKSIVPSWYINEMSSSKASKIKKSGNSNNLYGLQLWTLEDKEDRLLYFRGILGQYIIVSPQKKWVVVRLGHEKGPNYVASELSNDNLFMEGHSKDFIEYVKFAKIIVNKSN